MHGPVTQHSAASSFVHAHPLTVRELLCNQLHWATAAADKEKAGLQTLRDAHPQGHIHEFYYFFFFGGGYKLWCVSRPKYKRNTS